MHEVAIHEIARSHEISLKTFLRSRDDGSVVAKEQSAKYGYHHNADKVAAATVFVCLIHFFSFVYLIVVDFECKDNN